MRWPGKIQAEVTVLQTDKIYVAGHRGMVGNALTDGLALAYADFLAM